MMENNSLKELVGKYNLLAKTDLFKDILLRFFNNEIKENEIVHNLRKNLELDFMTAMELANEILFLDKKAKEEILNELKKNLTVQIDLDVAIREIIGSLGFGLNEVLLNRLKNNFISWLKGVRDANELKESLMKSEKIGGLSLSSEQTDKLILNFIAKRSEWQRLNIDFSKLTGENESTENKEVEENEIDVAAKPKEATLAKEKPTGQEVTIDQLLKEKGIPYQELIAKEAIKRQLGEKERVPEVQGELAKEITAKEEFLESKEEIESPIVPAKEQIPSPPVLPVQPKPAMPGPAPLGPQVPVSKAAPAETKFEVKQPLIRKTMPEMRPRVEDVKFTAQLVGPIDELAVLKIEDFRRLAKEPELAAQKIMAKLELLEEESLTKKAEGIKALKSSPLYKVYSDIMNQAIKEGKSIEQVTEENPLITMAEFKAIMELNKSLKY